MLKTMHPIIKNSARGLGLALALLATAGLARAAGFAIYENDARGLGMANANVGRNDDASALYSNPAAITQLPGIQIVAGASFISPSVKVSGVSNGVPFTTPMNDYTQIVPHVYGTYRINDDMAVGIGVFVPFGLKSDFPSQPIIWPGAYNNYMTKIQTIEIAPTLAYRLVHDQPWAKQISVAAGLAILRADVDLRSLLPAGLALYGPPLAAYASQPLRLKGNTWEYGYNLSVQYEINNQVSIGAVYRSGFNLDFTGASATIGADPSREGKGQIKLPDSFTFGANYSPIVPLNIGIQATWTGWSRYDYLNIQIPTAPIPTLQSISKEKHWSNVWRYSLGAEYQINNQVALRGGVVIDKDPVNKDYAEFMVPSDDRQIYSIGLGWTISKNVTLDFAFAYLKIKNVTYRQAAIDRMAIPGLTSARVHGGYASILSVGGNFRF